MTRLQNCGRTRQHARLTPDFGQRGLFVWAPKQRVKQQQHSSSRSERRCGRAQMTTRQGRHETRKLSAVPRVRVLEQRSGQGGYQGTNTATTRRRLDQILYRDPEPKSKCRMPVRKNNLDPKRFMRAGPWALGPYLCCHLMPGKKLMQRRGHGSRPTEGFCHGNERVGLGRCANTSTHLNSPHMAFGYREVFLTHISSRLSSMPKLCSDFFFFFSFSFMTSSKPDLEIRTSQGPANGVGSGGGCFGPARLRS
jgi:hypothetical protein